MSRRITAPAPYYPITPRLAASAIAEDVWAERGVFCVETKSELEARGFGRTQQIAPSFTGRRMVGSAGAACRDR
jgi:hypothetical protein